MQAKQWHFLPQFFLKARNSVQFLTTFLKVFNKAKLLFSESGITLLPYVQLIVFWGVKFEERWTFDLKAVVYKFVQKASKAGGFQFVQFWNLTPFKSKVSRGWTHKTKQRRRFISSFMNKLQCQISLTNIQVSRRMKLKCVVPVDNAGYLRAPRPATDTGMIQAGSSPPQGRKLRLKYSPQANHVRKLVMGSVGWFFSFYLF